MKKSDFDLSRQSESTESKIVASLERISQAFRILLWQESKEFSLSPIQVQVLIFLLFHNKTKRTVSYLADEFNMTKATLSDTVKALEQKGLIKKVPSKQDNRSFGINLTKKGTGIAQKNALFTEEIRTPIDQLSTTDKENLLLSLLNIISHLNQTGIITIQRMCMSCTHYQGAPNGETHFCSLLNQPLQTSDLRIDCPEHELKE